MVSPLKPPNKNVRYQLQAPKKGAGFVREDGVPASHYAPVVCVLTVLLTFCRNDPQSNKKPTQSLAQRVSKNLAKHHYFQSIPGPFQCCPVTALSCLILLLGDCAGSCSAVRVVNGSGFEWFVS